MKSQLRIGVASTVVPKITFYQGKQVRRPSLHFCRMSAHAKSLGVQEFCLFSPKDVNWSRGVVRAWKPEDPQKPFSNWVLSSSVAIPDAIYENVFVHLAVQGFSTSMRMEARKRGIPVFNPPLPGKWQMHRTLQGTVLETYLPLTERLENISRAVSLIQKWDVTYVKPIGGYGGMGVTRIESIGNGRYRIAVDRAASGANGKIRTVVSAPEMRRFLERKRSVPHLIQQGIHLMSVQNRKVDFRAVVQRDGAGKWQVVGIVPKMAAEDGVVTNIIAGGARLTYAECASLARKEGKALVDEGLRRCAIEIAQHISKRAPLCGILGFDLGIDTKGKVYMIEMNPKPARSLLSPDMRNQSAVYSAEFAVFLAKNRLKVAANHTTYEDSESKFEQPTLSLWQEDVKLKSNMSRHGKEQQSGVLFTDE